MRRDENKGKSGLASLQGSCWDKIIKSPQFYPGFSGLTAASHKGPSSTGVETWEELASLAIILMGCVLVTTTVCEPSSYTRDSCLKCSSGRCSPCFSVRCKPGPAGHSLFYEEHFNYTCGFFVLTIPQTTSVGTRESQHRGKSFF